MNSSVLCNQTRIKLLSGEIGGFHFISVWLGMWKILYTMNYMFLLLGWWFSCFWSSHDMFLPKMDSQLSSFHSWHVQCQLELSIYLVFGRVYLHNLSLLDCFPLIWLVPSSCFMFGLICSEMVSRFVLQLFCSLYPFFFSLFLFSGRNLWGN